MALTSEGKGDKWLKWSKVLYQKKKNKRKERLEFRSQKVKKKSFPSKREMNHTLSIYKGPSSVFVYIGFLSLAGTTALAKVQVKSRTLSAPKLCDLETLRELPLHLEASSFPIWRQEPSDLWLMTVSPRLAMNVCSPQTRGLRIV